MADLIEFTPEEVEAIGQEVVDTLAQSGKHLNDISAQKLSLSIDNYFTKISWLESNIKKATFQNRESALEQMKAKQLAAENSSEWKVANDNYEYYRKKIVEDLQGSKIDQQAVAIFKTGYKMVQIIREYITSEKIEYHVAIEGGKTVSSVLHSITEEQLLSKVQLDLYRFSQAIIKGEEAINFGMRFRATKKYANLLKEQAQQEKDETFLFAELAKEPKDGSTLWSKGYKVYLETRKWYNSAPESIRKGFGINFGHFLEAYYHMGGNAVNRTLTDFDNITFLQFMLSLQNSTKFYEGGDYGNIQLKSNTATLTELTAIRNALESIQEILNYSKGSYEKNLRDLFKPKIKEAVSQPRELPADLVEALNKIK